MERGERSPRWTNRARGPAKGDLERFLCPICGAASRLPPHARHGSGPTRSRSTDVAWQLDVEASPELGRRVDMDPPAVRLDDLVDDVESEPETAGTVAAALRARERVEEHRQHLGRHVALIPDLDRHAIAVTDDVDRDRRIGAAVPRRVP